MLWGDWEPKDNGTNQTDVLRGGDGNDFLYPSHGKNMHVRRGRATTGSSPTTGTA